MEGQQQLASHNVVRTCVSVYNCAFVFVLWSMLLCYRSQQDRGRFTHEVLGVLAACLLVSLLCATLTQLAQHVPRFAVPVHLLH